MKTYYSITQLLISYLFKQKYGKKTIFSRHANKNKAIISNNIQIIFNDYNGGWFSADKIVINGINVKIHLSFCQGRNWQIYCK